MRDRDEMRRAMAAGMGAGMGEAAGAGIGRAARGLSAGMGAGMGGMGAGMGREFEVPTRENMLEEAMRKSDARRAERMREKSFGEEAMDAAKSYGRSYREGLGMKKGGKVKKMKKGGTVSSASKRADGCAVKGKTKGRFV
jgi:hypothetical protein